MRGVFVLGDEQVVVREMPDPRPGPGQVVVRVMAAGICGSDLHNWYARPREELARSGGDATVPGHEASGVIASVGDGVATLRPGDRVVVWAHCNGDCERCVDCQAGEVWFCRRGETICPRPTHGGDADLLLAESWQCLRLPDSLDFDAGSALACVGGTAYKALRRLDVTESQTVAIVGAGPQGLALLVFARALGARTIVAEPVPERLGLARLLGADTVIDAAREDVAAAVRELTGGRGAEAVFECSGSPNGQREAIEVACPGGRIGYIGYGALGRRREGTVNPASFIRKHLQLFGCSAYRPDLFPEVARFAVERRVPLESIITRRFRLEEAAEAFGLCDSRRAGKILLLPGG